MGNIDECGAQSQVELGDLGTHLSAELSVEVGKRLVKKEDLRLTDDSTTHGNTLTLTTGESLRLSVKQMADVEDLSGFFHAAIDLCLGILSELQTECHVLTNRHMGIKSVALEHHGDVSVFRGNVVGKGVANVKLAFADVFQTSDHTQGGGLTASGRTDEDDKFFIFDLEVEILNSYDVAGILLVNVSQ